MKLQTAPSGWLNLLRAKIEGQNPDEIGRVVVPTIDAADLYGLPVLTVTNTAGNLQNPGDGLSVTVPQNEMWRLRAMSLRAALGANSGAVAPFITLAGLLQVYLARDNVISATAGGSSVAGLYLERPLMLPPGSVVGFINGLNLGAAVACTLGLLFERLPA